MAEIGFMGGPLDGWRHTFGQSIPEAVQMTLKGGGSLDPIYAVYRFDSDEAQFVWEGSFDRSQGIKVKIDVIERTYGVLEDGRKLKSLVPVCDLNKKEGK